MLGPHGECGSGRAVVFQGMGSSGPTRDSLTTPEAGLIWSRPGGWTAFDPHADPEYRSPLDPTPNHLIEQLRNHVATQNERAALVETPPPTELSPEPLDQLRALGYLDVRPDPP